MELVGGVHDRGIARLLEQAPAGDPDIPKAKQPLPDALKGE